jgi:hypothetical protein
MHVRTQIRNAVVARLTGLPLTGANVFASRVYPIDDTQLPALLINTDGEEIEPNATGLLIRSLALAIRVLVRKPGVGLDDDLDTIAEDVEEAMATGPLLAGASEQMTLTALAVEFDREGDAPFGVLTLNYRIDYITTSAAPGSAL